MRAVEFEHDSRPKTVLSQKPDERQTAAKTEGHCPEKNACPTRQTDLSTDFDVSPLSPASQIQSGGVAQMQKASGKNRRFAPMDGIPALGSVAMSRAYRGVTTENRFAQAFRENLAPRRRRMASPTVSAPQAQPPAPAPQVETPALEAAAVPQTEPEAAVERAPSALEMLAGAPAKEDTPPDSVEMSPYELEQWLG